MSEWFENLKLQFDLNFIQKDRWQYLLTGLGNTLRITLFACLIGIALGTLIAIYSPTKRAAMRNILPFCLGMLLTYYATAMLTHGVYNWSFILGWTAFAFLSPVMAYFAWMAKGRGAPAKVIGAGIVLVSILSSIVLFDRLRIYDLAIDGLLIYFLFFRRVERRGD